MKKGFTLVELLVVVAIISIFAALGIVSLRRAAVEARLSEGTAQLMADLQRARSGAQRYNQASTFVLNGSTSYSVTVNGRSTTKSLPAGVSVTVERGVGNVTYTAPFGLVNTTTSSEWTLSSSATDETRGVKILGVTGKAYGL